MSEVPISDRAARHVAAFNHSVRFVSSGDVDEIRFAWDSGSTGTMILRWSGDLTAELTVTFSR
jgi:hypothetical protein